MNKLKKHISFAIKDGNFDLGHGIPVCGIPDRCILSCRRLLTIVVFSRTHSEITENTENFLQILYLPELFSGNYILWDFNVLELINVTGHLQTVFLSM